MPRRSLNGLLGRLRKLLEAEADRRLTDRELLDRFIAANDESAFGVLIERHGPMVMGVCRRALPNFHDAEDACQAAFLTLARKARSVRKKISLGSWLHGVALRIAAGLKREHSRRKTRECAVAVPKPNPHDPADEATRRELQAIVDEELDRLPDRCRAPLILCYLEGLSRDEAARHLGVSSGSLHGRLERGREMLRSRLARRGVTLAVGAAAIVFGEGVAGAAFGHGVLGPALSPRLVVSSKHAAGLLAAGEPVAENVIASRVLVMTQEALRTMFLTKLLTKAKLVVAGALCAGLFAALIGVTSLPPGVTPRAVAQPPAQPGAQNVDPTSKPPEKPTEKKDAPPADVDDATFLRRMSLDLRGREPTLTEIHFFTTSKDPGRRQKLIDLLIKERLDAPRAKEEARLEKIYASAREYLDRMTEANDLLESTRLKREIDAQIEAYAATAAKAARSVTAAIDRVDSKDPSLVVISVGSDSGVARDQTLEVYRLKPTPMYVGQVRVVEVEPSRAVARRVDSRPGSPAIAVGDVVRSVIPPEPKIEPKPESR